MISSYQRRTQRLINLDPTRQDALGEVDPIKTTFAAEYKERNLGEGR